MWILTTGFGKVYDFRAISAHTHRFSCRILHPAYDFDADADPAYHLNADPFYIFQLM
jgi:hypothetical protein